jgi:hypothetical protein
LTGIHIVREAIYRQLPALFPLLEEEPQPGCAFERLECPEFCA